MKVVVDANEKSQYDPKFLINLSMFLSFEVKKNNHNTKS